jgi:hypothetical protein
VKSWSIHLIGGKKMQLLGSIEAVSEAAAIERAVVLFALDDERSQAAGGEAKGAGMIRTRLALAVFLAGFAAGWAMRPVPVNLTESVSFRPSFRSSVYTSHSRPIRCWAPVGPICCRASVKPA